MSSITHESFLKEIIEEQHRLQEESLPAHQTALMAYEIAYTLTDMTMYDSQANIQQYIANHFHLDGERIETVSSFLWNLCRKCIENEKERIVHL